VHLFSLAFFVPTVLTIFVLLLFLSIGITDVLRTGELEKALLHFVLPQHEIIASLPLFSGINISGSKEVFRQLVNSLFCSLVCFLFPACSPSAAK
jgi:hypothetical protein